MHDLLLRTPRWLTRTLASSAAGVLLLVSVVGDRFHGWKLVLCLVAGVIFAVVGLVVPELQHWQDRQAARLALKLAVQPPDRLPAYRGEEDAIDSLLQKVEHHCLASLSGSATHLVPARTTEVALNLDELTDETDDGPHTAISLGELEHIEQRQKAGQPLSKTQEEALAAVRASLAELGHRATIALQSTVRTSLDNRTPEAYRQQVRQYICDYHAALRDLLRASYIEKRLGILQMTLENLRDKSYDGVEVVLRLPKWVKAFSVDDRATSSVALPQAPRPYGTAEFLEIGTLPNANLASLIASSRRREFFDPRAPEIETGDETKVVFHPRELLAEHVNKLDPIILIAEGRPGAVIDVTWEARAMNADGCVKGGFQLTVDSTPLPVQELLAHGLRWDD